MKRVTASSVLLKVALDEPAFRVLEDAVRRARYPENWRPAERAMTKATAEATLEAIRPVVGVDGAAAEVSYFDWSVLTSEVARLWLAERTDDLIHAWLRLKRMGDEAPGVAPLLAVVQANERAAWRLQEAKREFEAAQAELRRAAHDAAVLADPDPEFQGLTREEGESRRIVEGRYGLDVTEPGPASTS